MWESLISIDHNLFYTINVQWSNPFFDWIMPLLRNKYFWIPLYIFIISFVAFNFKDKLVWFLLCSLITISLADTISSKIIKKQVKRERPCQVFTDSHTLIRCGSGYSFTSSHATNHFAVGTFFLLFFAPLMGVKKYFFWLWALIIGVAQIYVGVHFPLDIFGGAFVGILCGFSIYKIYSSIFGGLKLNQIP